MYLAWYQAWCTAFRSGKSVTKKESLSQRKKERVERCQVTPEGGERGAVSLRQGQLEHPPTQGVERSRRGSRFPAAGEERLPHCELQET
jgi:hypothetical protein